MATWINPVYDRTKEDVLSARDTLSRWIASNPAIITELKGCLNVTDLNRIEGNTEYLAEYLLSLGFYNNLGIKKDWVYTDIPRNQDVNRVIKNVKTLFESCLRELNITYPNTFKTHYKRLVFGTIATTILGAIVGAVIALFL